MLYTDNPLHDFAMHEAEQEKELEKLPECCNCGFPIQQDTAVYINGEWLCDDCLKDFRRAVVDI